MYYPETRPYGLLRLGEEVLLFVTRKGYSLTALRTTRVLYTYSTKEHVYLFVSAGSTHLAEVHGFTLVALRTDASSGKILERIQYF